MLRVAVALGLALGAACVLPPGDPCCSDDVDCAAGARCFEGRCALRCTNDAQCDEGSVCTDPGHVCRAADPSEDTLEGCSAEAP
jgi:hypothetical protein